MFRKRSKTSIPQHCAKCPYSQKKPWTERYLLLITTIITVAGMLTSVYISNHFSKQQLANQQAKSIVEKRMALIDKTASAFAKSPGIIDQFHKYAIDAATNNYFTVTDSHLSEKMSEYNAEFQSVLTQDHLYFGPKTAQAIQYMSDKNCPWWEQSRDNVDNLLVSMHEELCYGVEDFYYKK